MPRFAVFLTLALLGASLSAQTPLSRFSYEDRSGTTGHSLAVDGKTFGPYKEVTSVLTSTSGTAGMFLATKRDKTYVIAQGKEWGPLTAGHDVDQSWITVKYNEGTDDEEGTTETLLWINGKSFGPFQTVSALEYSETGGHWLATIQRSEDEYDILFDGKPKGPFKSVTHAWMFPDGKGWGWATTGNDDLTTVVTQDKTYTEVQSVSLDQMYPRSAHWAYGLRLGDEEELIVVDGKAFTGYLNFSGLYTTYSGHHWGFEAEKLTDAGDYPVVVIDGKEYVGEGLGTTNLGDKESFTWSVKDGAKVTVQVLTLP